MNARCSASRGSGLRAAWRPAILVGWLLCAAPAWAGEGTTGADFLRLPAGARSAALAGAYSALGGDAETIYFNPAGLVDLLNPQVYLSHLAWWESVTLDSAWGVQPLNGTSALGAAVVFLNVPPFNSTGDPSAGMESACDAIVAGGYALRFGQALAAGGALKYLGSQLGPARSWGLALDLGAKYYLLNDQLILAATVRNVGLMSAFEHAADALPLQAGVSAAYFLWPEEPQHLALAAELTLPAAERPALSLGAEGWIWNKFALRAGVRPGAEAEDWLRVGAGVRWERFHLDYAWTPVGLFGPVHQLSAGYDFATQKRLGRPRLKVRIATKQVVDASGEAGTEVDFLPDAQTPAGLLQWQVVIRDRSGRALRHIDGAESLPLIVPWDGRDDQRQTADREGYYTYVFRITDRSGYIAEARGEILPVSVTQLPQLKVLPRDIFAGKVSIAPKDGVEVKEWKIAVVSPEGKVMKQYQGIGAIPKDFAWDGTDQENRRLSVQEGYYFLMQIKDEAGNQVLTTAPLVQVDAHSKAFTSAAMALPEEVPFHLKLPQDVTLKSWALDVTDFETGRVVRTFAGEGRPPERVNWDSRSQQGELLPNDRKYSYVLRLQDMIGTVWQQAADLEATPVKVLENTDGWVVLRIEQILFDFNKAELKPGMFEKLRKTVDLIRQIPPDKVKLLIEGHTDEIGTEAYNYELSLNRARMVMRYLVEEEGLPSTAMETKGCGKSQPSVSGTDPQAQAMNRRVEITIWIRK